MNERTCSECGRVHPPDARFCMYCGYLLSDGPVPSQNPAPGPGVAQDNSTPAHPAGDRGTDWAAIVAAFLAFLGLQHMTRKARQTSIVIVLLIMFFGCPMVCGFIAYVMEWFGSFFR